MPTLLKSHRSFDGLTQFWQHASRATQTPMKFSTFVPATPPNGCIIWLSGLTCTDENFISKAGAQKYLAAHGLMVICPDTSPRGLQLPAEHDSYDFGSGASFYLNATTPGYADHYRMETYIVDELHELVQNKFNIPSHRIAITGHSMGGHGALVLGLRNPNQFCSISAMSPICHPTLAPWGIKAFTGYFGESEGARALWAQHDATELLRAGKRHPHQLLIDQGTADDFYPAQLLTEHLRDACVVANQPASINLRDGYDHSYYFIATHIEAHIAFHAARLLELP